MIRVIITPPNPIISLPEGSDFPKGYGLYRRSHGSFHVLCAPIPLNILLRLCYFFHLWLLRGAFTAKWEDRLEEQFNKGFTYANLPTKARSSIQ